jgi:hypothetical protein
VVLGHHEVRDVARDPVDDFLGAALRTAGRRVVDYRIVREHGQGEVPVLRVDAAGVVVQDLRDADAV